MPSCTAITVPTLAVSVSLPPNPAMFFSMMALISSAQDAIVIPPYHDPGTRKGCHYIFMVFWLAQPCLVACLALNHRCLSQQHFLSQTRNQCCSLLHWSIA